MSWHIIGPINMSRYNNANLWLPEAYIPQPKQTSYTSELSYNFRRGRQMTVENALMDKVILLER